MIEKEQDLNTQLEHIRGAARKGIHLGAITESYSLDIDEACAKLNRALATEVLCVLRYRHHEIIAKGLNAPQVVDEFREHAENEAEHARRIAERINQLGGDPQLDPVLVARNTATEYGNATELMDMVREDLVAERVVIDVYRGLIEWFGTADPTTRRMLEEILADEEEHASDLADILATQPKAHPLTEVSGQVAS